MKIKLKETNHSYYCQDSNYYVGGENGKNFGRADYDTWSDFKEEWLNKDLWIDHDYNHCFRFDIKEKYDSEEDTEIKGEYSLHLYYMLQRKGNFVPVNIKTITDKDMEEVNQYLEQCWNYLKEQWFELS